MGRKKPYYLIGLAQFLIMIVFHMCLAAPVYEIPPSEILLKENIEQMLQNYTSWIPPNLEDGEIIDVVLQLYLASFDSIKESDLSYSVTIYLRQEWTDKRLAYDSPLEIPLNNYLVDKIWTPSLIFDNERSSNIHSLMEDNQHVKISPEGNVFFVSRISLTLFCEMDFHKFPMDEQRCGIEIESFHYKTDQVLLQWVENEPAEFNKNHLKLPQYEMHGVEITNCTHALSTGAFSCVGITFLLFREIGYYLLQTFLPSILLIILSWVSFWIDIKASPARTALGITSVLTMITTLNGVREDLPHVSYIKAIDIWFAMCLLFVVGALIEFALVHYLSMNKIDLWRNQDGKENPSNRKFSSNGSSNDCIQLTIINQQTEEENEVKYTTTNRTNFSSSADSKREGKVSIRGSCRRKPESVYELGKKIDNICRVLFPVSFLIFNCCYWIYFKS